MTINDLIKFHLSINLQLTNCFLLKITYYVVVTYIITPIVLLDIRSLHCSRSFTVLHLSILIAPSSLKVISIWLLAETDVSLPSIPRPPPAADSFAFTTYVNPTTFIAILFACPYSLQPHLVTVDGMA